MIRKVIVMEPVQESMMKWGEALHLVMENRSLFYSPVLKRWRVKKWTGKRAKSLLFEGESLHEALAILLEPHRSDAGNETE